MEYIIQDRENEPKMDTSFIRLLIRTLTFMFLLSSFFTTEWFGLTKYNNSFLVKIGIFKYCNEEKCFPYEKNNGKYILSLIFVH